ncbi:unnamed protein product [Mytilus edulis]|uniref:Uncharacterized protein n=1 Tax=Mytilus edulis TaxID=6550 RepID=A0A8S3TWI3_MYTED|nr:unnamed protein product [Mytilus edulis]
MMICLLRNIGGLSTPSNGWDTLPHPNDTLPGANLATLKWYRNQLAHTTVTVMDNKEFTDKWTLVEKVQANEALVETWLNDDDLFYETKGSELVYDKVMDCSCILVTSKSGLGKTATIRHIAIKLQQKGYEIVPIESPRDIIKFNTNTQQVFLIDDVLGKYDLSPTLLEKWERLNEKLITCLETNLGSSKILCTLRLHIVSQERFQNASTILNKVVFNLEHDSNILSKDEKQKILLKHLSRNNLEKKVSANEVEIMCESNYAFPLLCKLVSNDDDRFQKRIAFFKQPLSLLNEELTKMRLENKKLYCILVVCMLFNGSISRSIFDIDSDTYDEKVYKIMHTCGLNRNMSKKELEDSALSAIGSYFSKDSNNIWFIHDALEETIGCHFQTFNPRIMYSECDILFIRDRIRVVSNEHRDGSIDEHIVVIREDDLDKDSLSPLYYRFWTELNNGRFSSVLMSHLFKNRAFVYKFGIIYDRHIHTILFKASSERRQSRNQSVFEQALKILSNEKFQSNKDAISRVIEARDVRSTLIDWIVAFGCYEFFKYGWNKMTTIERKLILGRYGTFLPSYDSFLPLAVLGGSIDIVTKLIRHGADVNCFSEFGETPLCIAVKTDQIDMVDLLLKNEAQTKLHEALRKNDLEQLKSNIQAGNIDSKTKSGLTVLHYAILLDDVKAVKVLFRHEFYENDMCSVPTPNVSIVENNGLTAVHLAVINNNVDILYLLLLNKADLNICDNSNRTPLHYTTSESATKLLLAYNTQNRCLETNRIEYQTTEYKKRPIISALKTTFLNITLHTAFRGRFRDFVNLPDKEGNTPLHAVIERRLSKQENSDCINVLLENGSNPSLINDMCISALELMDRCGDTEKYVNDSATHRQLIEKTHKKLALSTLILTALTFLFFNYLIINKENQDNFNCGEQDAEPGNIILVQVMKRRSVLLTAILLWTILMLTYNVRKYLLVTLVSSRNDKNTYIYLIRMI